MASLRERARELKAELYALWLATGDERVPWYAKAVGAVVLAYALSPIDLIPDFIPVLGLLDDLLLVPADILLFRRLVPAAVLEDCRARSRSGERAPKSRVGAIIVILTWTAVLGAVAWRVHSYALDA